jgi:hypothetical protein
VRTSQRRRRGRGLAIAGLAASAVWIVVVVVLVVVAVERQPVRSADGTVVRQGTTSPENLRVGDCVKLPVLTGQTVDNITITPCSNLHNAQVFTIVNSTDASYPGDSTLEQQGLQNCQAQAPTFLGTSSTSLDVAVFVPTKSLLDNGDRGERCLLVDRAENFSGDIRNHS